jgi:hypothetical protein
MHILISFLAPLAKPHAYLDPGSGSIIVQLLVAAGLGAAFAVRVYWKKIKAFFSGKKNVEEKPAEETPAEEPKDSKPAKKKSKKK